MLVEVPKARMAVTEMIIGDRRKEILVKEAFAHYGGDQAQIDAFLSRRYKEAGNQTPLEMAQGSESGLHTARILMKPVNGC